MRLLLLAYFISLALAVKSPSNKEDDSSKDITIQELLKRVNNLEKEIQEMPRIKHRLEMCEMGLHNLSASKSNIEQDYKRYLLAEPDTLSQTPHVAFYAHLSKNVAGIGVHHPIIFDAVQYNDGGAYNNVDGEFTAKVPGTYFFIWTISARDGTYMETELVVNGAVFGHVIGDAADHNDWGVATGFAIVRLNINDVVLVRSGPTNNGHLTGVGFGTSSFGGYLLYQ